ncbi:MAG TPA: efflux transporter outer membrane subunit [Nitrospiria bacterium]|nr:efflux transporter outer membrane subunit [Nitrospiria bacterium]
MNRKHVRIVVLAATLALLGACAVGPDYVRPTIKVPTDFKEMNGWKVAEPKDDGVRGTWWELFNDPLLNTLEEQVNISNQNVVAAEAQFRAARALVQAARSSYFPTVTAGASFTRSNKPSGLAGNTKVYSLPVEASWEADVWGRIRRTVEANEASAQASAADLEATRLSVRAELAQDYFQLRALDAQKGLLDSAVVDYQRSLELTKNRYASGVAAKSDILQAETLLKTTEAQALDVGVQRAQLEHAIALLIGTPASLFSIPVVPLTAIPPVIPVGVPSELLERRPDIAAAERRVAAGNAEIGVAKAAFFPAVTLGASGGFQASDLASWLMWPSRFWAIGPAILETVFDGGLRRAQTDQVRAAYDADVASYRQTVLTGFQEVEDNLAALRILDEEARVQDEAVQAARQSVTLTTNQYKAGIVNYLDVVTVEVIALSNERTAANILGNRMSASVLLIKALGGGWNASALPSVHDLAGMKDGRPASTGSESVSVNFPVAAAVPGERRALHTER